MALEQEEKEQREEAALKLQRLSRVRAAKIEAGERRKRTEAAVRARESMLHGELCFGSCFACTADTLVPGTKQDGRREKCCQDKSLVLNSEQSR